MWNIRLLNLALFIGFTFSINTSSAACKGCDPHHCKEGCQVPFFDSSLFSSPTVINNQWLPLIPGTQFVLDGHVVEEGERHHHRQILTVTNVGKEIDGVLTLILLDQDFTDGQLVEEELTFVAQDDAGNVWNLGEYPEEYEEGQFIGAPSTWIAGIKKAKPGIHMLAQPKINGRCYAQGKAIKAEFFDCAKVVRKGRRVCIDIGCFTRVLVIDEWDALEPESGTQRKFYAPGVGLIQIKPIKEDEPEYAQLVSVVQLTPTELTLVNDRALLLDQRAYIVAPKEYSQTPPAQLL